MPLQYFREENKNDKAVSFQQPLRLMPLQFFCITSSNPPAYLFQQPLRLMPLQFLYFWGSDIKPNVSTAFAANASAMLMFTTPTQEEQSFNSLCG